MSDARLLCVMRTADATLRVVVKLITMLIVAAISFCCVKLLGPRYVGFELLGN